jgi:hypothetical protein
MTISHWATLGALASGAPTSIRHGRTQPIILSRVHFVREIMAVLLTTTAVAER